ncbi:MAG: GNAT family N-acetyltransferase [Candidatus Omnitrophica bacterium]|nr:GNAT family N-acetyltransferase [Candidatus Omnitrophota bacterium]
MIDIKIRTKQKRINRPRIILSPIKKDDLKKLFEWINNPDLVKLSNSYRPISWQEHMKWWGKISKDKSTSIFGIRSKDDRIIGCCKLTKINRIYRSAELQIRIGDRRFLSKGYGTEAVGLLLRHAWKYLKLKRVSCFVFEDNRRAIRSYIKAGFNVEGIMRKAACIDGIYKDIVIMGILKDKNL